VFSWNHFVVLLNPDTGEILERNTLPTGSAGDDDGHYKHLTVAPDGTLIIKQQNRPFNCTKQGSVALSAARAPAVVQTSKRTRQWSRSIRRRFRCTTRSSCRR
jgi:hypothetical protein